MQGSTLSFRLCMGLAMPVGHAQSYLANQFRAIIREDPVYYAWLSSLCVFLLWVPLRFLFVFLFWLALNTPEGRRHNRASSS